MKISELANNVVERVISIRGHEIKVGLMPDIFTFADTLNPLEDKNAGLEIISKCVNYWDAEDDDGNEIAKDVDTLKTLPDTFLLGVLNEIIAVKNDITISTSGKKSTLTK